MKESEKEKTVSSNREFLEINEENNSNRLEDLVLVVDHNKTNKNNIINFKEKDDDSQNKLPPWKRKPISLDNDILKRAKNFLSLCETIGNEKVTQSYNEDKHVVMNVHMGVFDINGKLPEDSSLSNNEIVDVSNLDFKTSQDNELCQIERDEDDSDDNDESDNYEDDITGSSFRYDPDSKSSLEEQMAIHKMLTQSKSGNGSSKKNKNFVQVISSKDNE
ncbi:hypothetical protein [Cryptosporidium parvum Iowa II]|uniref:Uncharacterized protein n=2 Tax=Cryptosporidium parvum TaxID=5807 RepID=Q5CPM6_CRYPI|nr:hypothetical protein [Cryptosporidium parvum Iowa II]EAK87376.1 hypothetical protein cgd2_260 [Cryptosporidium parvum Iowa II]QOY43214.1 Uncharacterized protein CPATCC_0030650 [Cryptosporidium parvum]WKS76315.1 hypothetical protein CPCDC_2g260 [Cryptosporidium sp. 43IA8]WRK30807.1 Uncharacterized protein cpbgf_200260 [Cryptosporidium parvum]|eukprot:QOY43214.1 hypothetical protein CPATCC_000940 [Cryptosporidium parvum]